MDDARLNRQSRHALLDGFDEEGVRAVGESTALIVGLGGLGCPAALYLAASGIGELILIDGDAVDITNLSRQTLYTPGDVGRPKVAAACESLKKIAPECSLKSIHQFADEALLQTVLPQADIVLDCTDNWQTRQSINASCVKHAKPLVSGSAIQWSGQLMSYDPRRETDACYACVFDPTLEPEQAACGAFGVLSPMVGAIGSLQAAEALKMLITKNNRRPKPGLAQERVQRLSLLDMRSGLWQQLTLSRNPACPVCAKRA